MRRTLIALALAALCTAAFPDADSYGFYLLKKGEAEKILADKTLEDGPRLEKLRRRALLSGWYESPAHFDLAVRGCRVRISTPGGPVVETRFAVSGLTPEPLSFAGQVSYEAVKRGPIVLEESTSRKSGYVVVVTLQVLTR